MERGRAPKDRPPTQDPSKILHEATKYYEMLFAIKDTNEDDAKTLLRKLRLKRIKPKSAARLEELIGFEETERVLENLPLNKQPGPDRIPNGVYRCLSSFFAPYLTKLFRRAVDSGTLPKTMLEGDISLKYTKKTREQ